MACAFCAGDSGPERERLLGLGLFHGADVLLVPFFAAPRVEALFPAAVRRATVLFTAFFVDAAFFAGDFLAAVFLTAFLTAFLPVALRAPVEGADLRVAALPALVFLVAARVADGFLAGDVPVAFFATAFFLAAFFGVRLSAALAWAAAVVVALARFPAGVLALAASSRRWYCRAAQRWPASPPQSSQAM
nr:hypothetical protein [Xanthomonas arboricola]